MSEIKGTIVKNKDLAPISWFKVGGAAENFFTPVSIEDLSNFLKQLPIYEKITIIGNLSNTLIRDGGIRGFVIKLDDAFFKDIDIYEGKVEVGAGCVNRILCLELASKGLSGLEFLNAIPGTIGGAINMNAGAFSKEVKDAFISCRIMDRNGKIRKLFKEDIRFNYRNSSIKEEEVILSVTFQLEQKNREIVEANMNEMSLIRTETQPGKEKTGGSTFRNPSGDKKAWELIDSVGLRGYSIGGAKISEKHTNFIINYNDATANDIEYLINLAKSRVYEETGIMLESEIRIIGEY